MCLDVRKIKHSYKLETINGERLIPVWKLLLFIREGYGSPVQSYEWQKGWNKSSRKLNYNNTQWLWDNVLDQYGHKLITLRDIKWK